MLVLTDGSWDHASSRTRAILYFKYFRDSLKFRVRWIPRVPGNKDGTLYKWTLFPVKKRLLYLRLWYTIAFYSFRIVYIQRMFLNESILKKLKHKGTKIVFDFDDSIYHSLAGEDAKNRTRTIRMLTAADQIIVASPELESFCRMNGFNNVNLIPTPVETERFRPFQHQGTHRQVVIGWIGSPSTTRHLKIIQPALKSVCKASGARLLLLGAQANFSLEGVPIEHLPWSYDDEPMLLSKMDIGIMPLDDSILYAKGKGGYKLFQYMAAGLPVVASPLGFNSEIVVHGQNGYLATTNETWEKYLANLIEHPEERERMGSIGRAMAEISIAGIVVQHY